MIFDKILKVLSTINIEIIILQYSLLFELQIVPEIIQIVLEYLLNDENCLNFAKLHLISVSTVRLKNLKTN